MDPDAEGRRLLGTDDESSEEEITPGMIIIGIILAICLFLGVLFI